MTIRRQTLVKLNKNQDFQEDYTAFDVERTNKMKSARSRSSKKDFIIPAGFLPLDIK